MNFFKYFPHTNYTFTVGASKMVMDITNPTTRIKIQEQLKKNITVLYDYIIQDGDRPDSVSTALYGSPDYTWVILIVNNIMSLFDWPLTNDQFELYVAEKYGSVQAATQQLLYYTADGYLVDVDTYNGLDASERDITKTMYDFELDQNEAKRRIQVVPAEFIVPLSLELQKVVS